MLVDPEPLCASSRPIKAPLTEEWLPSSFYQAEIQWYNAGQGRGILALMSKLPGELSQLIQPAGPRSIHPLCLMILNYPTFPREMLKAEKEGFWTEVN